MLININRKFDPLCLPDTDSSALSTAGCSEEAVGMGLSKPKWLINQVRKTRGTPGKYFCDGSFPRGHCDLPFVSLNSCKGGWPCPSVALPGSSDEVLDSSGRARRVVYIPSSALIVHHCPPRIKSTPSENWDIRGLHFDGFPLPKTSLQFQTVNGWRRHERFLRSRAVQCAASAPPAPPLLHAVQLLY